MTISEPHHGKEQSLKLTIAPLAVMVFEWKGTVKKKVKVNNDN
jgi:hypothetical protein